MAHGCGYEDTMNKQGNSPFKATDTKDKPKDKPKETFLDKAAGVASFITNPVVTTMKALYNDTGAFEKPAGGGSNSTDFFPGGGLSDKVSDYNKSVDKINKKKKTGMSAKMTQH